MGKILTVLQFDCIRICLNLQIVIVDKTDVV